MIQNIRVGIPIIGDQNWIGGITYIELLIKAISTLPKNERPKIYLIVRDGFLEAFELHQSIIDCLDGVLYWGQDIEKAETILPSQFIHCSNLQRLKEEIDFFYPVTADVFPDMCSASWIPDFQHISLPEFFSEEERQKRDESYKKIAEESRLVVFSSKDAENEFKKLFPDTKAIIRVLRFSASIAPELYTMNPNDIQKKYQLPNDFLICCNQFWAHKNHASLFQAIAGLSNQGVNIHLVCTGSTNDYRSTDYFSQLNHQIEELGIENLVHIVGFIPRDDQIQLIRRSMAVVQPSLFEGWSTVTEDARALGKTIILSDLPVHYEQAPDHAVYFDRYDVDSLSKAISDCLPSLNSGPDIDREEQAKKTTQKRITEFARQFCSIAFESQFIFGQKIREMNDELWLTLTEKIPDQDIQYWFEASGFSPVKEKQKVNDMSIVSKSSINKTTLNEVSEITKSSPDHSSQSVEKSLPVDDFEIAYQKIREPKTTTNPTMHHPWIVHQLKKLQFDIEKFTIDFDDYLNYFNTARYLQDYPSYYPSNIREKSLEHYIATKLLNLETNQVFIDVASQHSPVPEIYQRLFNVVPYRQDLNYPAGINGDKIGGDAANMPVPDGFADKMTLHCSLEHFEGDADIRFIREVERVLKPGGAVCILPLYLVDRYCILTDPLISVPQNVQFEEGALVCCKRGWNNRHGRMYDPFNLKTRILDNIGNLKLKIINILNPKELDPSCYVHYALLLEKDGKDKNISKGESYIILAEEKAAMGDIDGAIDSLFQCISQYPDNVDAYKKIAVLMFSKHTYQSARNMLEKAIAIKPEDAVLYFYLGTACQLAGDHSASDAAFKKALAINPQVNEVVAKSAQSTQISIDQKLDVQLEKELSALIPRINQHILLSRAITENLEAIASHIEKILSKAATDKQPCGILPDTAKDNSLDERLQSLKDTLLNTDQASYTEPMIAENPNIGDFQLSSVNASEEYLQERIQISERLNLEAPLPIEELNHAIQILSSVFSDPETFFSSQENLEKITPAFFALLHINIETALSDGDYQLAENLKNIDRLLSSSTGIKLPEIQKEKVPVSSPSSDNGDGKTNFSLIFFHIPKAGGTSLDEILECQFEPSQVYTMDRIKVEEAANEFKKLPIEEREKYRLLKGHMWFGLKLHEYMPQPCKYITMLREPIARVISHYYYAKRTANHYLYEKIAAEKITLKDYVTRQLTLEVNNGQTRVLADLNYPVPYGEAPQELLESAKKNLHDYFAMVGLMERFDESLLIMKRLFGWEDVFYERKNVSKERSTINELPADVLDVIVAHNQLDIQLYQYVQTLLEEMIAQQGESFIQELEEFQLKNQQQN